MSALTAPLDLTEDERNAAYDRLQARLPDVWRAMRLNEPGESVVVVPSVSLDRVTAKQGAINQAMEERYLFLLLLLRQPRLRMVYVTSSPIDQLVALSGRALGAEPTPPPTRMPAIGWVESEKL